MFSEQRQPQDDLRLRGRLGFRKEDVPLDAFTTVGNVLTFGVVLTRIDLINDIDGITYEEARPNVVRGTYGGVKAYNGAFRQSLNSQP